MTKPSDYWYTPKEVLEAVEAFLGPDYFDPCPVNPKWDGLKVGWKSDCYINPPYSQKLKGAFIDKAFAEFKPGDRYLWMFNYSNSRDLWRVHQHASAVLIPKTRFWFVPGHPKLPKDSSPMYDNIMILWGDPSGFSSSFMHLGKVYKT